MYLSYFLSLSNITRGGLIRPIIKRSKQKKTGVATAAAGNRMYHGRPTKKAITRPRRKPPIHAAPQ
jgi:hypothetical protein